MFNDAMLGKQVWRLFHVRNSLVFKVLSTKYFPSSNIFDAELSLRCSFAWKSIMQTRDGVLKGARWRVGNGVNIQIWQHRWLPIEGGGKVLSPQWDPSLQVVCDLFLPGSRIWNEELIDQSFYSWEAKIIKSIPVSKYVAADALIWPLSSNGEYTVRSAYKLLVGL